MCRLAHSRRNGKMGSMPYVYSMACVHMTYQRASISQMYGGHIGQPQPLAQKKKPKHIMPPYMCHMKRFGGCCAVVKHIFLPRAIARAILAFLLLAQTYPSQAPAPGQFNSPARAHANVCTRCRYVALGLFFSGLHASAVVWR